MAQPPAVASCLHSNGVKPWHRKPCMRVSLRCLTLSLKMLCRSGVCKAAASCICRSAQPYVLLYFLASQFCVIRRVPALSHCARYTLYKPCFLSTMVIVIGSYQHTIHSELRLLLLWPLRSLLSLNHCSILRALHATLICCCGAHQYCVCIVGVRTFKTTEPRGTPITHRMPCLLHLQTAHAMTPRLSCP